jgi:hypothetical protein
MSLARDSVRAIGSYTLVVEGFLSGEVDHFAITTGVQVRSGQETTATVTFNSFRPVLNSVTTPTTAIPFVFSWPAVQNADAYIVELDDDVNFTAPLIASAQITGTAAVASVVQAGTYYVRARAVNSTYVAGGGGASASASVDVIEDVVSGPDPSSPAYQGFMDGQGPYTVSDLNILPVDDEDWFSADVCELDTLVVETFAQRLAEPSPLDTYLEVWDPTATTIIAENDDIDAANLDSYVEVEVGSDGEYLITVFSATSSSAGSYELSIDVKRGPNNDGSRCTTGPPPVASVVVSPALDSLETIGQTVQMGATAFDDQGNPMVGVPFTWRSSDPTVASVDLLGLVTAIENGTVQISAVAPGNVSGSGTIVVLDQSNLGTPTNLDLISGNGQFGAPSAAVAESLVVRVTDVNGDGVPFIPVNWSAVTAGASVSPVVYATDAGGYARAEFTLGSSVGTYDAQAEVAGLTGSPVTFTATATNVARWVDPVDGNWSDGTRWSTGSAPTASEVAVIDVDGSYTVTLDVDASVQGVVVGGPNGGQELFGFFRSLSAANATINPSAQLTLDGSTFDVGAVTNSGFLLLNNSDIVYTGGGTPELTNAGIFQVLGTVNVAGDIVTGTTSLIDVGSDVSDLTVANGFTNAGSISFRTESLGAVPILTVTNGTLVNAAGATIFTDGPGSAQIDADFDNGGLVNVADGQSLFLNGSTINNNGNGLIVVNQNADLEVDGAFTNNATITVGNGAILGSYGDGFTNAVGATLLLNSGSTLDLLNEVTLFQEAYTVANGAFVYVDGSGALGNSNTVTVAGELIVSPNASIDLLSTQLTADQVTNGGDVTLDVASIVAPVANGGDIYAATAGNGINGAVTTNADSWIEIAEPGAELTVTGDLVNDGTIKLYSTAAGTAPRLTVTGGTLVHNLWFDSDGPAGGLVVVDSLHNTGELHAASGGTFTVQGPAIHNAGTFVLTDADMTVTDPGALRNPGTIILNNGRTFTRTGGTFESTGTLTGSGTFDVSTTTFTNSLNGVINPGNGIGSLEFVGDVTIISGAINIELNGRTPVTEHDVLNVSGNITLAGELGIIQGFTPVGGDTFQILTFTGTRTGEFETITGDDIGGGNALIPFYDAQNITLQVGRPTDQVVVISAEAFDRVGALISGATFNWASLNPNVVTVDASGLATAVTNGQALVAAEFTGVVGYAVVTVTTPGTTPANVWANFAAFGSHGWGTSESDLWVCSAVDEMSHWNGSGWTTFTVTMPGCREVWGTASDDVFVSGMTGSMIHWDGAQWTSMNTGSGETLTGLWGSAPNDVYAVGLNGTILHYDGSNWTPQTSPTALGLSRVWGTAADDIYAAGPTGGAVFHYDGSSWSTVTGVPTAERLIGIWGSGQTDIFFVGDHGAAVRYDGSWNAITLPATDSLRGLGGASSSDLYAVGLHGALWRYNGLTWQDPDDPSPNRLFDVWASPGGDMYAFGDDGTFRGYRGASVAISAPVTTLDAIDAQVQLTAEARDAGNNPISGVLFQWSSDNEAVAMVDGTGLVTAVSNGIANIWVNAPGGAQAVQPITVQQVRSSAQPPSSRAQRWTPTAIRSRTRQPPG